MLVNSSHNLSEDLTEKVQNFPVSDTQMKPQVSMQIFTHPLACISPLKFSVDYAEELSNARRSRAL